MWPQGCEWDALAHVIDTAPQLLTRHVWFLHLELHFWAEQVTPQDTPASPRRPPETSEPFGLGLLAGSILPDRARCRAVTQTTGDE